MAAVDNSPSGESKRLGPGTFEYIEARIRNCRKGTDFGYDFEWLCQWFLQHAPRFRGMQFKKVWLWKDWPDRWGPDAGIDIVALDCAGDLWAVQSKADAPERKVTKREIDSFLSESSRCDFAYRLLIATTDKIGANARRVLNGQAKPVGLILRGDLISEQLTWPTEIGKPAKALPRWKPRPHQVAAIKKVVRGFTTNDRGQLIMACGTGKTLTALWIAERLKSRRSLVLVPSLSLVGQHLAEWGRHAGSDFDALVVCSDPSVTERQRDTTVQSVAELGVKVTTEPAVIRRFLTYRRQGPAIVFATYQSSERVAEAQSKASLPFDLAICDEAHRLAGSSGSAFATVLDGKKIKARKRLFMTATPRYIKEHVKRQAAELDYQLVSMDDEHVFGSEFHTLTFHEAITANPPLLTDYQVVVIGVTDREAREWVEQGRLVRTDKGFNTDARSLAARIGLAKAMKKYDLRRIISFHSSVARAVRFVDADRVDSLPAMLPYLSRSSRPSGKLWARHISGETPAGKRRTLLRGLGDLPEKSRGIISNCACLGEGVDVPALDGIAFIDPKRSMVDIIQAVGRVIRKAEGKEIGTVVVPVLVDEMEDADHALSSSAFEPVWQVLKALRAHDARLADELDELRVSIGRRTNRAGRIRLPENMRLDCPRMLLAGFEQAFFVRTVMRTTCLPELTIAQILSWADEHRAQMGKWPKSRSGTICGTDETWAAINAALNRGNRSLPGHSSLPQLLAEHRGVRNHKDLPELTIEQILAWADEYHAQTGKWPTHTSGFIRGTNESWTAVYKALSKGNRGLTGGSSLAKLLAEHRGVRNRMGLAKLTKKQILGWADEHHAQTGDWPTSKSGIIPHTDDTWQTIDVALQRGGRGLNGSESLARFLADHRGVRNPKYLPKLTVKQIVAWADKYHEKTKQWPTHKTGLIAGTNEAWGTVDGALRNGSRGLRGRSSLARLLADHRGVRNPGYLPELTPKQILGWADQHHAQTGKWPTHKSGIILGTNESWMTVDKALRKGSRSLRGSSSLARLLAEHRGVRNRKNLPRLTPKQILGWADQHHAQTGRWPTQNSGTILGTDETWSAVNAALSLGIRGLSGGTSLSKLLEHRKEPRNT